MPPQTNLSCSPEGSTRAPKFTQQPSHRLTRCDLLARLARCYQTTVPLNGSRLYIESYKREYMQLVPGVLWPSFAPSVSLYLPSSADFNPDWVSINKYEGRHIISYEAAPMPSTTTTDGIVNMTRLSAAVVTHVAPSHAVRLLPIVPTPSLTPLLLARHILRMGSQHPSHGTKPHRGQRPRSQALCQ